MAVMMNKQINNLLNYQIPLIIRGKDNVIINNDCILGIIENMVEHKLKMDKISNSSYGYHHVACFWYGISCPKDTYDFW